MVGAGRGGSQVRNYQEQLGPQADHRPNASASSQGRQTGLLQVEDGCPGLGDPSGVGEESRPGGRGTEPSSCLKMQR